MTNNTPDIDYRINIKSRERFSDNVLGGGIINFFESIKQ
jgi:hypothetical protein